MKIALFFLSSLFVTSAMATNGLTKAERVSICEGLNTVIYNEQNECFFSLAIDYNDSSFCRRIKNTPRQESCERLLHVKNAGYLEIITTQTLLLLFVFFYLFYIITSPPRFSYLLGGCIGVVVVYLERFLLKGTLVPTNYSKYIDYISFPIHGLLEYTPASFQTLDILTKYIFSSFILYGIIIGLASNVHNGKNKFRLYFICSIALATSLWIDPSFAEYKHTIQQFVQSYT